MRQGLALRLLALHAVLCTVLSCRAKTDWNLASPRRACKENSKYGKCAAVIQFRELSLSSNSCAAFCESKGAACVAAWNEKSGSKCSAGDRGKQSCDKDHGRRGDAICKCGAASADLNALVNASTKEPDVAACNKEQLQIDRDKLSKTMVEGGSTPALRAKWANLTNFMNAWCGLETPDLLTWCKSEHSKQLQAVAGQDKFHDVLTKRMDGLVDADSPCRTRHGGPGCKDHTYASRHGLHNIQKSDKRCRTEDDDCTGDKAQMYICSSWTAICENDGSLPKHCATGRIIVGCYDPRLRAYVRQMNQGLPWQGTWKEGPVQVETSLDKDGWITSNTTCQGIGTAGLALLA